MNPFALVNQIHATAKVEDAHKTWTLGRMIERLEQLSPDSAVQFAFGGLYPRKLMSFRGVYSQLALGYALRGAPQPTVQSLLDECRAANGNYFTGYKGGDFLMDLGTPVWVSNYGDSDSTSIIDIRAISDRWVYIYAMDIEHLSAKGITNA